MIYKYEYFLLFNSTFMGNRKVFKKLKRKPGEKPHIIDGWDDDSDLGDDGNEDEDEEEEDAEGYEGDEEETEDEAKEK